MLTTTTNEQSSCSTSGNSSFERARSVSRSRGQTAEEKAFVEMKKMLASYEALTQKLMTENASLKGRIDILEADLHQFKQVHEDALNASQEELKLERETRQTFERNMESELEKSKEELQTLKSQCASLDQEFIVHSHEVHLNYGGGGGGTGLPMIYNARRAPLMHIK